MASSCPGAYADTTNALAQAATVALKSGDATNADALATRALADAGLTPDDHARLLLNRGLAREELGRREEALVDYTAALQLGVLQPGDRARALFDRGVALDELGRTLDAIGDYTAALRLSPTFAPALNNRANAYRRTGKLAEAKHDYQASLAANNAQPEYPEYGLGQIAEAENDLTAAEDWYRKAIAANPTYALASQRLTALGNFTAPVLKPPPGVAASTNADALVAPVLKPPPTAVADSGAITLHPPKGKSVPSAQTPSLTIAPAAFAPPTDVPDLRPAIVEAMDDTAPTAAAADVPPPSTRVARSSDASQVQLGAWRAEAEAAEGWNHIVSRAGDLLNGMTPQIVMADIPGKGRYWRLRADPKGASASDLCARLQAQGIACITVK